MTKGNDAAIAQVIPIRPGTDAAPPVYILNQPQGSGGGGDETWRNSVENRLNNIHNDLSALRTDLNAKYDRVTDKQDSHLKWFLGLLTLSTLGLAGLIAHGFKWIG